jgi:nucleotide-binding universal stress UspA family protein
VWPDPAHASVDVLGLGPTTRSFLEDGAQDLQNEIVLDELGVSAMDLDMRQTVVGGDPARALVAASRGADLLVLGRPRWRRRHLLASTSRSCANRAACPVVLVRPRERKASRSPGG